MRVAATPRNRKRPLPDCTQLDCRPNRLTTLGIQSGVFSGVVACVFQPALAGAQQGRVQPVLVPAARFLAHLYRAGEPGGGGGWTFQLSPFRVSDSSPTGHDDSMVCVWLQGCKG